MRKIIAALQTSVEVSSRDPTENSTGAKVEDEEDMERPGWLSSVDTFILGRGMYDYWLRIDGVSLDAFELIAKLLIVNRCL